MDDSKAGDPQVQSFERTASSTRTSIDSERKSGRGSACEINDNVRAMSPAITSDVDLEKGQTQIQTQVYTSTQQKPPVISATDWNGPDDPDNPHNWPLMKRIYHSAGPAGMALVATYASSAYSPAILVVSADLGVSPEAARLPFVLFVLGSIFGAPIASPTSEAIGRKPVYLIFMPVFALFILGTGFAKDYGTLLVCRLFAGVFASPALSIGSGTVADVWPPQQRLVPMSMYIAMALLGPTLGPLIGEFVVSHKGWRWSAWTIEFFIVVFIVPVLFMSETYKKMILQRRAQRLGLKGPPSPTDGLSAYQKVRFFTRNLLLRPMHMLFTEPVVYLIGIYASFNFALQYAFFPIFPHVFRDQYSFSSDEVGLTFIGMGVGSSVGLAVIIATDGAIRRQVRSRLASKHANDPDFDASAPLAPEHRLYIAMLGAIFLPPSLFLFGWSAQAKALWIVPVIAEGLFGLGNILVFMAGLMYVTDVYGARYAASAMAANTFLRYILASCFPLFSVQMFDGLGIGGACSLLGGVSIVLAVIPWVFYKFGPQMRVRSAYISGT